MKRHSDLLNHPLEVGSFVLSYCYIDWENPRNFVVTISPIVAAEFTLGPVAFANGMLFVTATRKPTADPKIKARFAATFECDTDEPTSELKTDRLAKCTAAWPMLKPTI